MENKNQSNNSGGFKKHFSPKVQNKNLNVEEKEEVVEKPVEVEPVKDRHYGVLTGIAYSDMDVKKNQLPECVFIAPENLSEKELASRCFAERLERNCSDCKGCSSYNYYL